jgi:hypothetical protein
MRSSIRTVDMDKLAADPKIGSMLVRLMMVSNDIAIANESHAMWDESETGKRARRRQEARRYANGESPLRFVALRSLSPSLGVTVVHRRVLKVSLARGPD